MPLGTTGREIKRLEDGRLHLSKVEGDRLESVVVEEMDFLNYAMFEALAADVWPDMDPELRSFMFGDD